MLSYNSSGSAARNADGCSVLPLANPADDEQENEEEEDDDELFVAYGSVARLRVSGISASGATSATRSKNSARVMVGGSRVVQRAQRKNSRKRLAEGFSRGR